MLTLDRRAPRSAAPGGRRPPRLALPRDRLRADDRRCRPRSARPSALPRLAKARALMQRDGLGAILVEPGASLDYFTGVRWSRSRAAHRRADPREPASRSSSRPSSRSPRSPRASASPPRSAPGTSMRSRSSWSPTALRERKLAGRADRDRGDQPLLHRRPARRRSCRALEMRNANAGRPRLPDDQVAGRDRADAGGVRHHHRRLSATRMAEARARA